MLHPITKDPEFVHALKDKQAALMLALSNTATADIPGITQAGIPGQIYLTPVLDAEFVTTGKVASMPNIAETPKGVPTPALITRAVHLLRPFAHIALLDLGLKQLPQTDATIHRFEIPPSGNIAKDADIDAKTVFEKGVAFGQGYSLQSDYLILGESVPSGTTTARATALALGYDADDLFSSSFKSVPEDIRTQTVEAALSLIADKADIWHILGTVSDNMLLFVAGFLVGVNGRFPILLAGGTQMACALLVADSLARHIGHSFCGDNVALATTKWVAQDAHSDIKALLEMTSFDTKALYSDFDFSQSEHPALTLYDEGEAKEGVGAGGALVYAMLNKLDKETITRQVEGFLG
ncbi:MAG: TIGR00303 family protein [Sulfurovum sp.]|nr:TIGR00303 family protein [Sulfurovum sp.]